VSSVWSLPRPYNEGQLSLEESLETTVRIAGVCVRWPPAWELISWSNEFVVRLSPASKDANTEAEESTTLETVTRRQPMKMQQTEMA
jgi:hypothetical protein